MKTSETSVYLLIQYVKNCANFPTGCKNFVAFQEQDKSCTL